MSDKPARNKFTDASWAEMEVWQMRLDDWRASRNRAFIDELMNGDPPYDRKEAESRNVTNVNDLSGPRYMADARRSLQRALKTSDTYFRVAVDYGPAHKRGDWSASITSRINRAMKRNRIYSDTIEGQCALKCLHGIGPAFWIDRDRWYPSCTAIQDVLIPARTLWSMENLDHFAVFRQLTYQQLKKLTGGPHVDPAWEMDVVKESLLWVEDQTSGQLNTWAPWFSPQNVEEILKEDQGLFATSAAPTVDVWEWYFWDDSAKQEGWRRGVLLDTPYTGGEGRAMPAKNAINSDHGRWLMKPSAKRVHATKVEQILHFMRGDATSTAPFRYHGTRSLGWLLYPFCHLQNRLFSKFVDHVFENLLNYLRAPRQEDYESFVKAEFHELGLVPEGIQFVPQTERWQINMPVMELALTQMRSHMDEAAAQYREGRETQKPSERETATAVIARVNAAAALVGSLVNTTYEEMSYQDQEICRRFCKKNSRDPDVRKFRADVLADGVPPEALDVDRWDITPDKILGNGNKAIAMSVVQSLMESFPLFSPEAQREVLHLKVLNTTDDAGLANRLAPVADTDNTSAQRKAQNLIGSLMAGIPAAPARDDVPITMAETLLASMAKVIQRMGTTGPKPDDMVAMQAFAQTIQGYIALIGQDKEQAPKAKELGQDLAGLMKAVGQMGKALAQAAQQGQGGNGGVDPKDAAKLQGMQLMSKVKADNAAKSHAQKTAQRQVSFELQQQQDMEKHRLEMQKTADQHVMSMHEKALDAAVDAKREMIKGRMKSLQE